MTTATRELTGRAPQPRLIESDAFPLEFISALAERESWRKEIYRPVYHIHKWWANRLGSVFRGIILACLLSEDAHFESAFYQKHDFSEVSVFDPFMGSGTTVGEAHKLGCVALGRDINPVACESVRIALGPLDRRQLQAAFTQLHSAVGGRIQNLYRTNDERGQECDALYFFWVKTVPCVQCGESVDLFSSYAFARNAYPDQRPTIQVYCPRCGDIFPALNTDKMTTCGKCGLEFDPHQGPASGASATCPKCLASFPIIKAVRKLGRPPTHRLYAKLILTPDGNKRYLPATQADAEAYNTSSRLLQSELERGAIRLADAALDDGYNTRQAIGYNYRNWRDFFNDRQLLALGWLHQAIAELSDSSAREALLLLFSGVLEFNNMFATYKGEGTGAVRHMFSHHILKPEKMPIEANVWGTAKSSGSFSNLFRHRLLRAVDYRAAPFEVGLHNAGKVLRASRPFSGQTKGIWPTNGVFDAHSIYLSCGSSDNTNLPDRCVDLVITDPPFFDNVHYSELADFFYAWQSLYPRGFIYSGKTTRHIREVQDTDAASFAAKLKAVFSECYRVLKDQGTLAFTYHHSRSEGWVALAEAIFGAGFSIVNSHPVKAELSVATPKSQAKEPIQLDVVVVCKKREQDTRISLAPSQATAEALNRAYQKITRLLSIGLKLSRNDRRVVLISQYLVAIGPVPSARVAVNALSEQQYALDKASDNGVLLTQATWLPEEEPRRLEPTTLRLL